MRNLLISGALLLCAIPPILPEADAFRCGESAPTLQTFQWNKGDKPIQMIRAHDGFCFLSELGGSFAGGGEHVRVYVDDGWWWLSGRCMQPALWAKATCIRYDLGLRPKQKLRSKPEPADSQSSVRRGS